MAGALTVNLDAIAPLETAKAQLLQQNQVYTYVYQTLSLPQIGKPTGQLPILPEDLTQLDDPQLGYMLNLFHAWAGFVDTELAKIDGERKQAEEYLLHIQAQVRIAIRTRGDGGKKLTTQDKNDIMLTNPEVVNASQRFLFWEASYRLTKAIRDSIQLGWETISRRITQRGQEVERMRRETSVAGIRNLQRGAGY